MDARLIKQKKVALRFTNHTNGTTKYYKNISSLFQQEEKVLGVSLSYIRVALSTHGHYDNKRCSVKKVPLTLATLNKNGELIEIDENVLQ